MTKDQIPTQCPALTDRSSIRTEPLSEIKSGKYAYYDPFSRNTTQNSLDNITARNDNYRVYLNYVELLPNLSPKTLCRCMLTLLDLSRSHV